eukprot:352958-Chlamydomonas_euryale.AAC.12
MRAWSFSPSNIPDAVTAWAPSGSQVSATMSRAYHMNVEFLCMNAKATAYMTYEIGTVCQAWNRLYSSSTGAPVLADTPEPIMICHCQLQL